MLAPGEATEAVRDVLKWTVILDELADDAAKVKGSTLHQADALARQYECWMKLAHEYLNRSRKELLRQSVKISRVDPDGLGGVQAEFVQRGYVYRIQLRADWFRSTCKEAMALVVMAKT